MRELFLCTYLFRTMKSRFASRPGESENIHVSAGGGVSVSGPLYVVIIGGLSCKFF